MKTKIITLLLSTAMASFAQTHVYFDLASFNAQPATNRTVEVQALTPFKGNITSYNTGTNTFFYLSNALAADYAVTILKRGSAEAIPFWVSVPATNLGVVGAYTNTSVVGVQTYPTAGKSAWSIIASDSRYNKLGSSGVAVAAGTNVVATTNGNLVTISSTALVGNAITNKETRQTTLIGQLRLGETNGTPGYLRIQDANGGSILLSNSGETLETSGGISTPGVVAAGGFQGDGSDLVNLNASSITTGIFSGNGSGLTNLSVAASLDPRFSSSSGTITATSNTLAATTVSATTVNATTVNGNGAGLTLLNASQLASGTVPTNRQPQQLQDVIYSQTVFGTNSITAGSGNLLVGGANTTDSLVARGRVVGLGTGLTNAFGVNLWTTNAGTVGQVPMVVDGTNLAFQNVTGLGDLQSVNNLADVASVGQARTNLGANNGANITSGAIAEARIASAIARDSEISYAAPGTGLTATTNSQTTTLNVTLTNNTGLPGVVVGAGIGTNTTSLLQASAIGTAAYSNTSAFVLSPTNSGSDGQLVSLTGNKTKWVDGGGGIATNGGTGTNNVFTSASILNASTVTTTNFISHNATNGSLTVSNNVQVNGNSSVVGYSYAANGTAGFSSGGRAIANAGSSGNNNFVTGGTDNTLQAGTDYSLLGGGFNNSIGSNGDNNAIIGGQENSVGGSIPLLATHSGIVAGKNNSIWKNGSYLKGGFIAAGSNSLVSGDYSAAMGVQARASNDYTFVWSSGDMFGSTSNGQFLINSFGGVGINTNNPGTNALSVFGTTLSTRLALAQGSIDSWDDVTNYFTQSGGGTSGALTNFESRAVIFTNDLTVRDDFRLQSVSGSVTNGFNLSQSTPGVLDVSWLRNAGSDSGANIATIRSNANIQFYGVVSGNGSGLTNLNADELRSGTVVEARIDSAIARDSEVTSANTVVSNGIVSGLGAGSIPVTNIALTGTFRFTPTNTVQVAGVTNAITVVSNPVGYVTITLSGTDATTRGAARTYYSTANPLWFTNGATNGLYFAGSISGDLIVTNNSYRDATGDRSATALVGTGVTPPAVITSWIDNESDFNPQTVTMTATYTYAAGHAKFNGVFSGDGSALLNVPAPTSLNATNLYWPPDPNGRVTVADGGMFRTTNASSPGQLLFSSSLHGLSRGIIIVGATSGDVVVNPGYDGGVLQLGGTGRSGNRIYLQKANTPTSGNPNGFSHALEFRSQAWNSGSYVPSDINPGIVGMNSSQNDQKGQLVFYARVPYWTDGSTDLNRDSPATAGTEIFRMSTNGIVAASSYSFKGNGSGLTNLSVSSFTKTNTTTVSNTATETDVLLDGIGTTNLNTVVAGSRFLITGSGVFSTAVANTRTLTVNVYVSGGVKTTVTLSATPLGSGTANSSFNFNVPLTVHSMSGSTATAYVGGGVLYGTTISSVPVNGFGDLSNGGSSFTFDTSANSPVRVTIQWSGATSGDSVVVNQASVIRLN